MSEAYKEREREETQTQAEEAVEERNECPCCGTENQPGASFCEDCGHDLRTAKCCPKCGSPLPEGADICEACGEWLLVGQCKFCYTPLEEGARFCAACGNPVGGVECPRCHNVSYFDFCKYCDIPLTAQAEQAIEELKGSEELRELVEALQNEAESADTSSEQAELDSMKQYTRKVQQPETKREAPILFSKGVPKEVDSPMPQAQQGMQPRGHKTKREAPAALEGIQRKKFASNQEARRFSGALKVLLPAVVKKKVRTPLGWLCNVFDVLHPEGPQGCCAAHGGGRWIYEEYETEERGVKEVEI